MKKKLYNIDMYNNKAHYIIFHPDSARQRITVGAKVLKNNKILKNWLGDIWVDKINIGNEDPFIFNDPWLYSYCHASQLRRNKRKDNYLQFGSKIFFVSGDQANNKILSFDTIFFISKIEPWYKNPLKLPLNYKSLYKNIKTDLWNRYFRFPFHPTNNHKSVSHTYEAKLTEDDKNIYSYLPIDYNGNRVSIPFDKISLEFREKISKNVKGKYPVLLTDNEMKELSKIIEKLCCVKVLNIIKLISIKDHSRKRNCNSCM